MGNDTLVLEFIANTQKLTGTVVQVRKRLVNFSREIINDYYQILIIAESVTLRTGPKKSPEKPITGPWIRLTLQKHERHPNYVFCRPRIGVDLRSLAVYHSSSLHALNRKLDILAHQLHHVQPLNMATCPSESNAPSLRFGLPDDDEFGPRSKESENEYADNVDGDGVGPSGHS
ncbi:hypothetical protein ACH5RR_013439 [Cinchona calisaya]|uniref:Uncharacterized protein n=1 Tax=Cinchona calisaya TaxID=153742 RepID=A0ABD3A2Q0_9GENT